MGIVVELGTEALLFFRSEDASVGEFLSSTHWQPAILDFGIWPLVLATLTTSVIAMLVALPLGLAAAFYLSEYASSRVRSIVKPILEILAGIPTVVYGYFALTFMTPLLRSILGSDVVEIFNTASAGIVVVAMVVTSPASSPPQAAAAKARTASRTGMRMRGFRFVKFLLPEFAPLTLSGLG